MTIRYVDGTDGNDSYNGLAAFYDGVNGPKKTWNGAEDTPVVAGDVVKIRPGVYRELLVLDVSGGNLYTTGTVTLTSGSAVVTGAGTSWLANVAADYQFAVSVLASGADGVANGTATFTSAAGKFEASLVGRIIQIGARNAYGIGAVAAANSITLVDVNGVGWPAAGGTLAYSVMSGEGPYPVQSVDLDTQLTLARPWNGPTLTLGTAYRTYNPITYVGDVLGEVWGVGGTVRITGSDDDMTVTRGSCVNMGAQRDYRIFRGFDFDLTGVGGVGIDGSFGAGVDWAIEDCTFQAINTSIWVAGAAPRRWTIRRCKFFSGYHSTDHIYIRHTSDLSDTGHIVENCVLVLGYGSTSANLYIRDVGGVVVKNCLIHGGGYGIYQVLAPAAGQTVQVNNGLFLGCGTALWSPALGFITEDYNIFHGNEVEWNNVTQGAASVTWAPLFDLGLLCAGYRIPQPQFGSPSPWSGVRAIAGLGIAADDLLGLPRPATAGKRSWGPVQFQGQIRDTDTVRSGDSSICLPDACRVQYRKPVSGRQITVSVYVQWEADYAGVKPQVIVKQPGQDDRITTATGAAGVFHRLVDTFVPSGATDYVIIELVSNNTSAAGSYAVYFDDLR